MYCNIIISVTVLRALPKGSTKYSRQILFGAREYGTRYDVHVLGDDICSWIETVKPVSTSMSFHGRTNGQHNTRLQLQRV